MSALDQAGEGRTDPVAVRSASTADLGSADLARMWDLFAASWPDGRFTADDAAHALGGVHWLAEAGGRVVGHASVVARTLEVAGKPLATGYVEAVATLPGWRRRGIATRLMTAADEHIRATFDLGALSTGSHHVYARLGWERWRGPTYVRTETGLVRTEEEDDGVMVLRTLRTPQVDLTEALSCDWRPGDAW